MHKFILLHSGAGCIVYYMASMVYYYMARTTLIVRTSYEESISYDESISGAGVLCIYVQRNYYVLLTMTVYFYTDNSGASSSILL